MGRSSALEAVDILLSKRGSRIDPSEPGLEEVLSDDVEDVDTTEDATDVTERRLSVEDMI